MKRNWMKIIVVAGIMAILAVGCGTNINSADEDVTATEDMTTTEEDRTTAEEDDQDMDSTHETDGSDMEEADETTVMTNQGDLAPTFEFVDSDGKVYNNETFIGEKVYLKYWASWCSICLAGLDEVDTLFEEAEGFTIYTVVTPNANGEQGQADFEEWFQGLEQKNIKVLFDMDGQAAKEFGVRAFPTQVFIGSDGVLISTSPGHKSNEDIIDMINSFY